MTKQEKIDSFNPNSAGLKDSNIYGLPFSNEESDIILIPVPWEVTVSYGSGAAQGPEHILEASYQVDLYHPQFPSLWKKGIGFQDIPEDMLMRSTALRQKATQIIEMWEDGMDVPNHPEAQAMQAEINKACEDMNAWVEKQVNHWRSKGKLVGLVGGDHSTPLGFFRANAQSNPGYGILHIDAHMDLRIAYEGFTYSHASIMYNAMKLPEIGKLVQVGLRDFCEEEVTVAANDERIAYYTDRQLRHAQFEGKNWKQQVDDIIALLPKDVHISFDIDGLDPTLCPNTGTPVPGGLSYEEAIYLLTRVGEERNVISFDLVEVAPGDDDWNGNVGARLLFHLCGVLAEKK
ncbi:MAG: Agmatinase [Bacteroidota bacterium]